MDDLRFASNVQYTISVYTKNRQMNGAEQEAVHRAVQNALNLLHVQMEFIAVRDPTLVAVTAMIGSSSGGAESMYPETEASSETA